MEKTRLKKGPTVIPNKLYFRIGEVSDIVGVKPYVLRYWESEFPDIKPAKSRSGQRLYRRRDVENLLSIRTLLYEEKFTIDGARKRLKELNKKNRDEKAQEQLDVESEAPVKAEPVHQKVEPPVKVSSGSAVDVKFLLRLKDDLEGLLKEIKVKK